MGWRVEQHYDDMMREDARTAWGRLSPRERLVARVKSAAVLVVVAAPIVGALAMCVWG